jgi:hypothetical protein
MPADPDPEFQISSASLRVSRSGPRPRHELAGRQGAPTRDHPAGRTPADGQAPRTTMRFRAPERRGCDCSVRSRPCSFITLSKVKENARGAGDLVELAAGPCRLCVAAGGQAPVQAPITAIPAGTAASGSRAAPSASLVLSPVYGARGDRAEDSRHGSAPGVVFMKEWRSGPGTHAAGRLRSFREGSAASRGVPRAGTHCGTATSYSCAARGMRSFRDLPGG